MFTQYKFQDITNVWGRIPGHKRAHRGACTCFRTCMCGAHTGSEAGTSTSMCACMPRDPTSNNCNVLKFVLSIYLYCLNICTVWTFQAFCAHMCACVCSKTQMRARMCAWMFSQSCIWARLWSQTRMYVHECAYMCSKTRHGAHMCYITLSHATDTNLPNLGTAE